MSQKILYNLLSFFSTDISRRMLVAYTSRHHGVSMYVGVRVRADVSGRPRQRSRGPRARTDQYSGLARHCRGMKLRAKLCWYLIQKESDVSFIKHKSACKRHTRLK